MTLTAVENETVIKLPSPDNEANAKLGETKGVLGLVGASVGEHVGSIDGGEVKLVGRAETGALLVGNRDGRKLGDAVGILVGTCDGRDVGRADGRDVGVAVGLRLGLDEG
jgi:hypothetical protein